ncbi:MAG: GvpL/GvpF family gas vesicle protein [Actinomycetota bacterium]|nr:GvpL/GvpF family gas vesicle protein [Actinomycetota bacterium]
MSVLLYAVVDAASPPGSGDGLGQHPLRDVTHANLRAIVSDHDGSLRADEPTLLAYGNVVDRLMRGGALLPARFGTTAATDEEIQAMLFERRAEFTESLDRVRGAVEFAVRADAASAPAPGGTLAPGAQFPAAPETAQDDAEQPGTAYLRRRLAQEQHTRELSRRVATAAGEMIRASIHRPHQAVAYLVEQTHADEFARRTRALGLTVTGPWPPYSFARPTR